VVDGGDDEDDALLAGETAGGAIDGLTNGTVGAAELDSAGTSDAAAAEPGGDAQPDAD
jgi:hypothetical protein